MCLSFSLRSSSPRSFLLRACAFQWIPIAVLLAATPVSAQDTNFANGPQYLMNYGSPLFARPISTPSLSISGPALEVGASTATADLTAGAENQTESVPTTLPVVDLFPIYYGVTPAQRYDVEIHGGAPAEDELPASIGNLGAGEWTTPQELRERGYGITLAEAATASKARFRRATRVYTNADIDRLRGGS